MGKRETHGIKNSEGHTIVMDIEVPGFKYGYGSVQVSKSNFGQAEYAIVNPQFEAIMHTYGYKSDITFYRNGEVVIISDDKKRLLTHYRIMNEKPRVINRYSGASKINRSLFKVRVSDNLVALYDVTKCSLITGGFSEIEDFNHHSGLNCKLAIATYRLPYPNRPNEYAEISCIIDDLGRIRSPLYSSYDDMFYPTGTKEFNFNQVVQETKDKITNGGVNSSAKRVNLIKTLDK